jgi:hypothetical protein
MDCTRWNPLKTKTILLDNCHRKANPQWISKFPRDMTHISLMVAKKVQ